MSWERYFDLAHLAEANLSDEYALVSSGQASEALIESVINTVAVFADAYAPVARGLRGAATAAEIAAQRAAARRLLAESEQELAQQASREVTQRETAETVSREIAEQSPSLTRRALQFVQDIINQFMEALRRWGRQVFGKFGFKRYEVVLEGEWLVLYGINSHIRLARIRRNSVQTWIIENTPELQSSRHARMSQLGSARAASQKGNDALSNLLRQNAINLSEEIGEIAAKAVIESRFPSAVLIHQGSGSRTLDLIYRLGDGSIIIVEAKGGGGRLITRTTSSGRAEQGTVTYLRSLLDDMLQGPDADIADEVIEALDSGRLRYFLSETPIPRGTAELETTLSEFIVPR
jgi:hypothetical protein